MSGEQEFTITTKEQVLISKDTFSFVKPSGILETAIRITSELESEESKSASLETMCLSTEWGRTLHEYLEEKRQQLDYASINFTMGFEIIQGIPANFDIETQKVEQITADAFA